jgi:WhiB family redox-sensing transcriptional regulator
MNITQFKIREPHPYDQNPNWQKQGACHGQPTTLWFPKRGTSRKKIQEAKTFCNNCPIQTKCLEYALHHHDLHGIWGGLTEQERQRIRTKQNKTQIWKLRKLN